MTLTLPKTCSLGGSKTGLVGTVGVELLNPDGTTHTARATAGIYEIGGGCYGKQIVFPDDWKGSLDWDDGGTAHAVEDYSHPTVEAIAFETWEEILTGATHNIASSAGRRVREIGAYAIESGTAQAGNSHSITLAATASAIDGTYNRNLIVLVDNTGVGQTRTIVDYDGSTKVAIIDRDWRTSPDATTTYQVTPDNTPLVVDQGVAQAGTATTITLRAYASAVNDAYLCNVVAIIAGTGRGQARLVGGYVGATKVVTICGDNWVTNPDTTSVYVLMPYGVACAACIDTTALAQIKAEIDTDVATQDSASSFTCTAGVAADNAYIGMIVRVRDADDDHWEDRMITGWTAGREMTVDKPFSFTPAVNDLVWILSQYEEKDTTFVNR
jgi:hypothetical protein